MTVVVGVTDSTTVVVSGAVVGSIITDDESCSGEEDVEGRPFGTEGEIMMVVVEV